MPGGGAGLDEGGGDGEEGGAGGEGGESFAVGDGGLQDYPIDRGGGGEAGHHVEDVLAASRMPHHDNLPMGPYRLIVIHTLRQLLRIPFNTPRPPPSGT